MPQIPFGASTTRLGLPSAETDVAMMTGGMGSWAWRALVSVPRSRRLGHRRPPLDGRDITLELTPEATAWLADRECGPVHGARPLKRLIHSEVENGLAKALLDGAVADGDTATIDTTAPSEGPSATSSSADELQPWRRPSAPCLAPLSIMGGQGQDSRRRRRSQEDARSMGASGDCVGRHDPVGQERDARWWVTGGVGGDRRGHPPSASSATSPVATNVCLAFMAAPCSRGQCPGSPAGRRDPNGWVRATGRGGDGGRCHGTVSITAPPMAC